MNEVNTLLKKPTFFRSHVLSTLSNGVKNEMRFEELSQEILNSVSNQLLIVGDDANRQQTVRVAAKQLEEAKLVRRYNMAHESPQYNKQLNAALSHLSDQFKLKFSKYFNPA